MRKPISYVVHLGDNRYRVLTPNPYIVELNEGTFTNDLKNRIHTLNQSVKFFYNTLRVLGISKQRARERGYGLNYDTRLVFADLLINRDDVSHDFKMMIMKHKW